MADLAKYPKSRGQRRVLSARPASIWELAVTIHLAVLFLGTTWMFGGASPLARTLISWWGSLGILLLVIGLGDKNLRKDVNTKSLVFMVPAVLLNLLVFLSCHTLNFRAVDWDSQTYLVKEATSYLVPSTVSTSDSLRSLWLFDGIYFSCLNLVLGINLRRVLRNLLFLLAANASALAVFGTFQSLTHADGLYFGVVKSPQTHFFASFVYHNHWGAFAILSLCVGLGLIVREYRRASTEELLKSAHSLVLIGLVLITVSIPLSSSRSCSALAAVLLLGAIIRWTVSSVRRRKHSNESTMVPLIAGTLTIAAMLAVVWYVAGDKIETRWDLTREQVSTMHAKGTIGSRLQLYHDTWVMAKEMPLFGWGMGSYPHVFTVFNTQVSNADHLPVFYHDAHSDWLQSLAELGFVGTALLILCAAIPLASVMRRTAAGPIPFCLLTGCGFVAAYSAVEFPFGNPAVVLVWWMLFFIAIRYIQLEPAEPRSPQ